MTIVYVAVISIFGVGLCLFLLLSFASLVSGIVESGRRCKYICYICSNPFYWFGSNIRKKISEIVRKRREKVRLPKMQIVQK